jgi:DNA-binding winged helix-turn-helix (wHTH) protein
MTTTTTPITITRTIININNKYQYIHTILKKYYRITNNHCIVNAQLTVSGIRPLI